MFKISGFTYRYAAVIFLSIFSIYSNDTFAVAKSFSGASGGTWNTAANWTPSGVPGSGDDVTIPNGKNVTIDVAAVCNSFIFGTGASATTITISGTNSLTVTNAFTFQAVTGSVSHIFDIGAGTLTCGSLSVASTTQNSRIARFSISTGILDINGNASFGSGNPRNVIIASGACTFRFGGNFTLAGAVLNPGTTSTIEFDGSSSQTIETNSQLLFGNTNYPNLNIKGTGLKTLEANTPILAGRTLTIDAGSTLNASTFQITASGATATIAINGTFVTNDPDGFSGATTTAISSSNTSITLGANSTIEYNAAVAQTVSARTYSNLKIRNSNTKSLAAGTTTVNTNLGVATGATLAIGTATLNVTGQLHDTGTVSISTGVISVTGNTNVRGTFNITGASGAKTFERLNIIGTLNNSGNCPIQINGTLNNSGTYTVGTGAVTFAGTGLDSIIGSSTTTFSGIILNKGTDFTNHILDVRSPIAINSGSTITLTNGTIKISSASTLIPFNNTEISTAPGVINTTSGFWLDNASAVMTHNANLSVSGLFKITNGTFNLGNASDVRYRSMGSTFVMEGGVLNVSGRISRPDVAPNDIDFTMSGGEINVGTVGNTDAVYPPFGITEVGSFFTMSGGTIIIRNPGGAGLGIGINNSTNNVTGGTIQIGTATTPSTAQVIKVNSSSPIFNLNVVNANATAELSQALDMNGSLNISAGTLNANNFNINVGGNWTNSGTFTPGTATVTFDGTGTQTIVDANGETFNNLTVNKSDGSLQMNNNLTVNSVLTLTTGNISINGNTLNLAGTVSGSGKITGSNTSNISITGTGALGTINFDNTNRASKTINNFTINRTSTGSVTLGSDSLRIRGVLTITDGTINTNARLIITSESDATGRVAAISCGACGLNGNIVVERFIPGGTGKRKWRFLSAPINISNSFPFSQLIDDTWITGTGGPTNGFDDCSTCLPSLRTYNESLSGASSIGWENPASINSTILPGFGFEMFVRGNRNLANPFLGTTTPNDVILDMVGTLNKGSYTVNLSYTNNSAPTADGFNLIGNPYACPIDWAATNGWTKTNISNKIWGYNPTTTLYGVYDADLNQGTNGITSIISSGQGVFVKANASGASVTFTESVKSASNGFDYFREKKAASAYDIVKLKLSRDTISSDELILVFDQNGTKSGLDEKDAAKFFNDELNFYSKSSENYNLAINFHPNVELTDTINLSVFSFSGGDTAIGTYVISKEFINNVDLKYQFVLKDFYANTETDFRTFDSYRFNIDNNPRSMGNNRFKLLVSYKPVIQNVYNEKNNALNLYPNPATDNVTISLNNNAKIINYRIYDITGKTVASSDIVDNTSKINVKLSELNNGLYFVEVISNDNFKYTKKIEVIK